MPKFIQQVNINDQFTLPTVSGSDGQVLTATSTTATAWETPATASVGWTDLTGNQDDIALSDFDNDAGFNSGTVSGTGTDNRIAMFNGTANIQNSNIYYATNNYVGINTAPTAPLHIYNNEDGKSTDIILENGDQGLAVGQSVGSIKFESNDTSTNASGNAGRIVSIAETGTGGFGMSFHVKDGATERNPLYITRGGNVGINTDSPAAKLDIEGMSATVPALKVNAGSGDNMILDIFNSSNVKRMGLEYDNSNINFNIVNRSTTKLFTVREGGNVGIGDDTPSFKLDVAGAIRATGDVTAFSDIRVKKDVNTIENASEKVSKLRGVSYKKIGEDDLRIGVIAQEIEKVIPEVVYTDPKGMKSVAYANLVGLLIESNKELQKRIEILESK